MKRLHIILLVAMATTCVQAQNNEYLLGMVAFESERYAEASALLGKALDAYEQKGDTFCTDYAYCLNHKASSLYYLNQISEAIPYGERALHFLKKLFGTSHQDYINQCHNLWQYYYLKGNYGNSIVYINDIIRAYQKKQGAHVFKAEHLEDLKFIAEQTHYSEVVFNIANPTIIMPEVFDTEIARQWEGGTDLEYVRSCKQKVDDFDNRGDTTSLAYFKAIDELALAYLAVRDTASANAWILYGGPRKNMLCGENSLEAARSYYIYALVAAQSGMHIASDARTDVIFNMLASLDEKDDELYLNTLLLSSSSYLHMGVYGTAEKESLMALAFADSVYGKDSRQYDAARFQHTQYLYRNHRGETTAEIINLSRECYEWRTKNLGASHPDAVNALLALAHYLSKTSSSATKDEVMNNYAEAMRLYELFYEQQLSNLRKNFIGMSIDEQRQYWSYFEHYYQELIPLCSIDRMNKFGEDVLPSSVGYNAALLSKGILLNSENLMRETLQQRRNGSGQKLYNEIVNDKLKLKQQLQLPESQRTVDTNSLSQAIEKKQLQLAGMFQSYKDYTEKIATNWKDVQKKLGPKDAAIEFIHIKAHAPVYIYYYDKPKNLRVYPFDNQDADYYAAIILTRQSKEPEILRLFDMNDIGDLYLGGTLRDQYLAELLWKPIIEHLGSNIENLYFSPTGQLHSMPIESLRHWDGTDFMADHINLYRLSSTRELATHKKASGKDGVVYGGLLYNASVNELTSDARQYASTRGTGESLHDPDSFSNGRGAKRAGLPYLNGTMEEADKVRALLVGSSTSLMKVQTLDGKKGTEASFKALSGQNKRLIHIGTHGFFYSPDRYGLGRGMTKEDMAMICSGLYMAGADNKILGLQIPEGVDDGVLTSEEIACLDLRGLDLVTLSACQTAQGTVTGDGVFGLQRGFKKAGASAILMSLWSVDDAATTMLMTEFYRNWKNKMSKHDALERAKAAVRNKSQWKDPRYWAAFVLLDGID